MISRQSIRGVTATVALIFCLVPVLGRVQAAAPLATASPALAHKVAVGDHNLYISCSGKEGSPTVVMEAGYGDTSEVWAEVQPGVAAFTRVCFYARRPGSVEPYRRPKLLDLSGRHQAAIFMVAGKREIWAEQSGQDLFQQSSASSPPLS